VPAIALTAVLIVSVVAIVGGFAVLARSARPLGLDLGRRRRRTGV
jgi:hypothetical protein